MENPPRFGVTVLKFLSRRRVYILQAAFMNLGFTRSAKALDSYGANS